MSVISIDALLFQEVEPNLLNRVLQHIVRRLDAIGVRIGVMVEQRSEIDPQAARPQNGVDFFDIIQHILSRIDEEAALAKESGLVREDG